MAAPVDPFPNFVPAALADGDQVDARFAALYTALDRSKPSGGLDAASIKDGILVPGLTVIDPWQSLGLWGIGGPIQFYKDLLGMVHIRRNELDLPGSAGTIPGSQVLCTFPAGYRPGVTTTVHFDLISSFTSVGAGRMLIDTSGNLFADSAWSWATSGQFIIFNGESFRAEN